MDPDPASCRIEGSTDFQDALCMQVTKKNGSVGWLPDNLNQGRLDYYYAVLVVLSVINIFFFIVVAKLYKYKKVGFFWHRAFIACSEIASSLRSMHPYNTLVPGPGNAEGLTRLLRCVLCSANVDCAGSAWKPNVVGA